MYRRDQPAIARYAAASDQGLVDVGAFVLLSIREPFSRLPRSVASWRQAGIEAPELWGWKRSGVQVLIERAAEVRAALAIEDEAESVLAVSELIPGFGLPKAGFMVQLCAGRAGCMDAHNLRRFRLQESWFRIAPTMRYATKLEKSRNYVRACRDAGGPEEIWDSWCRLIADRSTGALASADVVSGMHVSLTVR